MCVTDTNDLDNQLSETFARQAHLAPVVRAGRLDPGGADSLHELLDVPGRRHRVHDDPEVPARRTTARCRSSPSGETSIVIADEAHRSQYDKLAQNLLQALPNATRIGFTGTPIELGDRSTRVTFGDYISVYRMAQAQEDGATVPIYYESRQVPVDVDRDAIELRARGPGHRS